MSINNNIRQLMFEPVGIRDFSLHRNKNCCKDIMDANTLRLNVNLLSNTVLFLLFRNITQFSKKKNNIKVEVDVSV